MFHFLKCPRPLRAKAADFSTNFIHYSLKIMRGAITAPTAPHVKNCVWLHVCRYANTLDTRASMYRRVQQRTALRHFSAVTAATLVVLGSHDSVLERGFVPEVFESCGMQICNKAWGRKTGEGKR